MLNVISFTLWMFYPLFKKSPHNSLCNSLVLPSSLHGLANVRLCCLQSSGTRGGSWLWDRMGGFGSGTRGGVLAPGEGTAGSGTREGVLASGPEVGMLAPGPDG